MTDFEKEVKYKISNNRAKAALDNVINPTIIRKIQEGGQEIDPYLMKNLFVSYKIKNQLEQYEVKWDIAPEKMHAAEGYRRDHEIYGTVSFSQSKYDGAPSSPMNANPRDIGQHQIDASRRITKVKMHFQGNTQRYNLLEMFVGNDISIRAIEKRLKMDSRTIKKRLIFNISFI